jgi:hypothetical protein
MAPVIIPTVNPFLKLGVYIFQSALIKSFQTWDLS